MPNTRGKEYATIEDIQDVMNQMKNELVNKMVVVDFYAPWCHWCKLLDPVWQQTAEQLPDQSFAKDVRMAKVRDRKNLALRLSPRR